MDVLINHITCFKSHWDGKIFHCRHLVTINRVQAGMTYNDEHEPDWLNMIDKVPTERTLAQPGRAWNTYRLKPAVMAWLTANVPDVPPGDDETKGWCVGNDEYNENSGISFAVFFKRRKDAMAFIKHWSRHHNPVDYLNYFKDIRTKLNPVTGRMTRAPR